MKPLVNSYIQKLVQTKWDVAVHGRDLCLVKPTLGPPKKFQHLTRAEEVVISRLRIGHTKATKSHILSRGPPTGCHHCGQTLTIDHMLLECALLQECRDEYYTVDSLNALFETIPETSIVEFLREAGFFYLIWCNLLTSNSPQTGQYDRTWVFFFREWKQFWNTFTCVGRLICPEGRVSSLNKSNPIQFINPADLHLRQKTRLSLAPVTGCRQYKARQLPMVTFIANWLNLLKFVDGWSRFVAR